MIYLKVHPAAGISALLQVILLILMFTVSRDPFGRISDYFYALTPLLILPLIFVLGIAMAIGILAGFFFLDELHAVSHGTLDWSGVNPLLYPVVLAGILTQIGLPVWLLWTARLILSGRIKFSG